MTRSKSLATMACIALAAAFFIRVPLGGSAAARPASEDGHTIAVCATLKIVDELMDSDRFKPEREEFEKTKQEQIQPLIDELTALSNSFQAAQAAGEDVSQIQQRGQALQQQLQQANQQVQQERVALLRKQLTEAYDLIKSSASAVASDLGFDYVVSSSRPDDEMEEDGDPAGEFLSRPMLVFPEDADITEDVREDLNLS